MSSSASSSFTSTQTVVTALAAIVLIRSAWAGIPDWAKNRITGNNTNDAGKDNAHNVDMTNPAVLVQKIKEIFAQAHACTDDLVPDDMPWHTLYCCFLSLIHLMNEMDANHPEWRESYFGESHDTGTINRSTNDIAERDLETLLEYLDYAQLAYNDSLVEVAAAVQKQGYQLIRHDAAIEPGRVGHFMAVHYDKKQLLISIKGTSTVSDVLTDIVGKAVPHPKYSDLQCHEGIYTAAQMMMEETHHLLEHFFQDYQIVICGHSLGAGVSTLLGIFLKKAMPALKLQVYAFATPACCSKQASLDCQSYITSVVNNNDCVPRLSLINLRTLHKLFMLIDEKLTAKNLSPKDWKTAKRYIRDIMVIDKDLLITPNELTTFLQDELTRDDQDPTLASVKLFVPGKVVSIWNNTKDSSIIGCKTTTGTSQSLRQLFVEANMVSDHSCDMYRQNLTHLMEQTANTI